MANINVVNYGAMEKQQYSRYDDFYTSSSTVAQSTVDNLNKQDTKNTYVAVAVLASQIPNFYGNGYVYLIYYKKKTFPWWLVAVAVASVV